MTPTKFIASKFARTNPTTGKREVFVREAVNPDRRAKHVLKLSPRQRKKLEREQRRQAREEPTP